MYMENDKLVIPDYIKNMSLEEIRTERERLYQKYLEEKEKKHMITTLNATQYKIALDEIKNKSKTGTLSPVELLVLDLCRRVDYLENENSRIRGICKK